MILRKETNNSPQWEFGTCDSELRLAGEKSEFPYCPTEHGNMEKQMLIKSLE